MEKEDREIVRHISGGVDRLVDGLDKLVAAIPQPASRIRRVFDALATFATVAGLLGIIQLIIQWIGAKMAMQLFLSVSLLVIGISLFCVSHYMKKHG
jgi:hypothetical protein